MNILITGGLGFIGSTLIKRILERKYGKVINIDLNTLVSISESLKKYENSNYYNYEKADICNYERIKKIFNDYKPDSVIHLAAESHVDRSILQPKEFLYTNFIGTYNLLSISKNYLDENYSKRNNFKFLHVSTDEVYGSLKLNEKPFTENSPYKPNSPYSASKAASDHLVRAWNKTYGLPTLQTHSANNYGEWQFPEKLIPVVILKCLRNENIPVYGDGSNIRDWIHVQDNVSALMLVFKEGKIGEKYNVNGNNELTNLDLINKICKVFDKLFPAKSPHDKLITFVNDRLGHDFRYSMNHSKISEELGFKPKYNIDDGLEDTVKWYIENSNWLFKKTNDSFKNK